MNFNTKTLLVIITAMLVLSSCHTKATETKNKLTEKDINYYRELSEFKDTMKNDIQKFITLYVQYYGKEIPEEDLTFIKNISSSSCYDNIIKNRFIHAENNTIDTNNKRTIQYEEGEILDIDGDVGSGAVSHSEDDIDQTEEQIPDRLMQLFYSYKDNVYIAKIGTPSTGRVYLLYITVEKDKVVNIHV